MTRTSLLLALSAAAALAGCDSSNQTIVADAAGPDPMANAVANAGTVQLPPSIVGSHSYRCRDNSLIFIDWYSDGSARVKMARNETGTHIPAPAPDATEPPSLTGSSEATSVTYNGKSCKR